jgi:hypothetical protein
MLATCNPQAKADPLPDFVSNDYLEYSQAVLGLSVLAFLL